MLQGSKWSSHMCIWNLDDFFVLILAIMDVFLLYVMYVIIISFRSIFFYHIMSTKSNYII